MCVDAFARGGTGCVFAGIALLLAAAAPRSFAQDNGGNAPAPAQQPPPPISTVPPGGLLREPRVLSDAIDYGIFVLGDPAARPTNGFYPELSNMITGSGWVSLGPGYRHLSADGQVYVDVSAALSWRMYRMAQGRLEFPRLAHDRLIAGVQTMLADNTQVDYFGLGSNATGADQSVYRLQTHDLVTYAEYFLTDSLAVTGAFGWLGEPNLLPPSGPFLGPFPYVATAFPNAPAVGLSNQPALLHSEAGIEADTRDHPDYPRRGFLYRAALTSYSDQTTDTFSFRQWEAQALQYVPVFENRVVLAFRAWALYGAIPTGHQVPFYLMPSVGGNSTLRAYQDYQFHDNNSLVTNAEARVALMTHVDAAAFVDAGNVAPRFSGLNLGKTSYGLGLRLHTQTTTLARLDVAVGAEGWRVVFRTTEPFRLARVQRQTANVPFAP